ncbi:MAG: NOL1/NOP2/sun family putative RNA methylase [Candidatus Bipolaricaulaceae bacterium]
MRRYRKAIGEWEEFQAALARPLPTVIRTNTLRVTPEELRARLAAQGLGPTPLPWDPTAFRVTAGGAGNTLEHWLGHYYVQEASQALPARALDPRPGETVLDMCAAPGGKATQVAQMMENRGTLVANDPVSKRLRALLANLYRLGVLCALVTQRRGEQFPGEGTFDRVLVDAPCSGEGTARKHPHLRAGAPPARIRQLAALQRRLLVRALRLVRPGGRVVYATCTLAPEENEEVVDYVLDRGLAELVPWSPAAPHASGLTEFAGRRYARDLGQAVRIYFHHLDSEGGFIAVLRRPH